MTLEIAAPADRVYALIADLPGMADLSPECARVSWIPPATAAVPGAQFRGVNRHGPFRWVTICTVERAEPGRELVFSVRSHGLPVARWRYRIVETSVGCTVVESTEDLRGLFARLAGPLVSGVSDRAARNAVTMRGTLARLKERAEGSTAADPTAADPTAADPTALA